MLYLNHAPQTLPNHQTITPKSQIAPELCRRSQIDRKHTYCARGLRCLSGPPVALVTNQSNTRRRPFRVHHCELSKSIHLQLLLFQSRGSSNYATLVKNKVAGWIDCSLPGDVHHPVAIKLSALKIISSGFIGVLCERKVVKIHFNFRHYVEINGLLNERLKAISIHC